MPRHSREKSRAILIDGGYVTFSGTAPYYHYYLKDHLGSNRVVVSPAGTATQVNHYYPFGGLFGESTGNTVQRFRYNDKEFDRTHGIDWYDYGARHMTPDAGRFTTIDPLAEKYYDISPYAYCANNPLFFIDPTGKDPGDYFDSIDKAALDFGKFYNALSIKNKKELSSFIYMTKDSWGNMAFSYTKPIMGEVDESNPSEEGKPKNGKIVGRVHSHGNWDEKYVNEAADGNERFSDTDKSIYNEGNLFGYVSTPKGKLLKWDPVDKISYLLSDKMPQDPKTVGKGERYIRTYKHSKGSTSESRRKSWYQEKYKESIINKIKSIFIEGK